MSLKTLPHIMDMMAPFRYIRDLKNVERQHSVSQKLNKIIPT